MYGPDTDGYDPNVYDDSWGGPYRPRANRPRATTTKESNVQTNEQLMAKRDKLLLEAAELENRVQQRETYGEDPFKNGDMLKVMITYSTSDTSYTYVAVKIRNKFYLSGRVQTRSFVDPRGAGTDNVIPATTMGWTWEHFVAWLASGNASVWIVEKLKKVL